MKGSINFVPHTLIRPSCGPSNETSYFFHVQMSLYKSKNYKAIYSSVFLVSFFQSLYQIKYRQMLEMLHNLTKNRNKEVYSKMNRLECMLSSMSVEEQIKGFC